MMISLQLAYAARKSAAELQPARSVVLNANAFRAVRSRDTTARPEDVCSFILVLLSVLVSLKWCGFLLVAAAAVAFSDVWVSVRRQAGGAGIKAMIAFSQCTTVA